MVTLSTILSGGQTGVDQAALRAARRFAIPSAGWMPKDFLTEDGSRPEFAELYGMHEMPTVSYPGRTRQNVADSDGTLWIGETCDTLKTPGGIATMQACKTLGRPYLVTDMDASAAARVVDWLNANSIKRLNVAGNRESESPGIGARAEAFLAELCHALGCAES